MSEFTYKGYILDTKVIYVDGADDVVTVKLEDGVLYCKCIGAEEACLLDPVAEYVAGLHPIGIVDDTLKLKKCLISQYEIGKIYNFYDSEDQKESYDCISVLSSIYGGEEYPLIDAEGNCWKHVDKIDEEMLGVIKG